MLHGTIQEIRVARFMDHSVYAHTIYRKMCKFTKCKNYTYMRI